MGWIWKDDDSSSFGDVITDTARSNVSPGDRCATRKVVKSHCRTEETEPGKFIRKCEKTEEIFKDCFGRPTEMVESNKEYTEEDVTHEMLQGSKALRSAEEYEPFNLPSLRSGMEAIERDFIGSFKQLFEAAEEMKNGFFSVFGEPDMYGGGSSSSASKRRGVPIEVFPRKEEAATEKTSDGDVDLSGLARDV